jgi:AhpD family alkylhydroperoxidase
MVREEVHQEMKHMFGCVLPFFDRVPDEFLGAEWDLLKRVHFGDTLIPNKYKQLICLGVAAVQGIPHSILFHTEMARLNGATDGEIGECLHNVSLTSGLALQMRGLQVDYERFAGQMAEAVALGEVNGPPAA